MTILLSIFNIYYIMSKPYVCRIVVQMKKHSQNGKICYEKRLNKDVGGKVVILCVNNKELVISLPTWKMDNFCDKAMFKHKQRGKLKAFNGRRVICCYKIVSILWFWITIFILLVEFSVSYINNQLLWGRRKDHW